ncbi:hypothetical protein [Streptomyces flavofungini]|uniref:hypothetical protein n=1 Tax=Streptomyces flavofungini TaxID=68200 RepID=UPI0034DE00F5
MRIRTVLAATTLAAAALLSASGTALADDGYEAGSYYHNVGGPLGITDAGTYHDGGFHEQFGHYDGADEHDEHDEHGED